MRKIILTIMIALPVSLFSQNESKINFYNKSIKGEYGYDIKSERGEFKGLLTLEYIGSNHLKFKIAVEDTRGFSGDIDGIAKIIDSVNAVFKSKDCKALEFKLTNGTVDITEISCNYFHGVSESFGGFYYQPIKKDSVSTGLKKRSIKAPIN